MTPTERRSERAKPPARVTIQIDRDLPTLLAAIRACRVCEASLPLGPRPIVQIGRGARLLIVGQAPGAKVHASGVPWDDASGERLRDWLGIDKATFYDAEQVAIVPVGFCYPGRGGGGDLPPRKECAPLWLDRVLAQLPNIELAVLIGSYAQKEFLGKSAKASLTETVQAFAEYAPRFIPLPHPSPRNTAWFQRHPWVESELLPVLRERVRAVLDTSKGLKPMSKVHKASRDVVIQRAYEDPTPHDGYRVLVDRFWPRGRSKIALKLDEWAQDLAPSAQLIHWFGHDPARWQSFQTRYREELEQPAAHERLHALIQASGARRITLVYGARSETENQAVVLAEVLRDDARSVRSRSRASARS